MTYENLLLSQHLSQTVRQATGSDFTRQPPSVCKIASYSVCYTFTLQVLRLKRPWCKFNITVKLIKCSNTGTCL